MRLLAFLHGLETTPISWQDQAGAMPSSLKAIAPWLRGLRPGTDEPFTIDAAADDVLGQLNVFGVDEMALCGLSLGALVALSAATRSPENVSHLVLVAGQAKPPKLALKAQRLLVQASNESRFSTTGMTKAKLLHVLTELMNLDLRESLNLVQAKTLVVVGGNDRINQPAAKELADGIRHAQLEIVPKAGQKVPMDAPQQFNDLLYTFLE